jgi:hypothetical protein
MNEYFKCCKEVAINSKMLFVEWVATQEGITLLSFNPIPQTVQKFIPFALISSQEYIQQPVSIYHPVILVEN